MKDSRHEHYQLITRAIAYIRENFKSQPSLDELAQQVNLSPYHFQRLFSDWAGVSPKKFLQYISLQHAKLLLRREKATLFDAAEETGLSGTGRLHDLFISIEAMTPGEYKQGGRALTIHYSYAETLFGSCILASTAKGLCYMAFHADPEEAVAELTEHFPNAVFRQEVERVHQEALQVIAHRNATKSPIRLHLKGTEFQLKVWEALLKIPMGRVSTYGEIAGALHTPRASRAVGTAIGSNPVAFLIPCHRVIQATGNFGGYMWGPDRKAAMIGWEAAQAELAKGR